MSDEGFSEAAWWGHAVLERGLCKSRVLTSSRGGKGRVCECREWSHESVGLAGEAKR